MAQPKLSHPSSGLGGRGYKQVFGDGTVVPSVTTALGALEKPGIVNWSIENTAAYAVMNIDELLSRTPEQGMRFLQFYTRRMKPEDLDDEEVTILNYSQGVLDDLADLGNFIHDWIEADLQGWETKEPWRDDQAEMIMAYLDWKEENEIRAICTERTVFGNGYAGTLDMIAEVNGRRTLIDIKSSRKVYDSHVAQLGALGAATDMAVETDDFDPDGVYHKIVPSIGKYHDGQVDSWWRKEPLPAFQDYAIFQVRPDDFDTDGSFIPAFAKLHTIDQRLVDTGFKLFKAGLDARHAQREFDQITKEIEKEETF